MNKIGLIEAIEATMTKEEIERTIGALRAKMGLDTEDCGHKEIEHGECVDCGTGTHDIFSENDPAEDR